jgi:hypothetical protein
VVLPLHGGHAPGWLVKRMKALAGEVVRLIVQEDGADGFLRRMSEPYWFQAFGCALGFDWHSSGLTTVVTGVLKETLKADMHGVMMAGGKGNASRKALAEIERAGTGLGLPTTKVQELRYASRICAKVDNAAIQAGYPIYHHAFFMSERGDWAVVQQGINTNDGTARRYHWLSGHVKNYIIEPHDAIIGERVTSGVLNMTAKEADENRRVCVDLVKDDPRRLISSIKKLGTEGTSLDAWTEAGKPSYNLEGYEMPTDLNWRVFSDLYDVQPRNYEELLAFKGVGPATVRALALVAQLVYGKPASWRDPVKFSFAHGGKDGVPYPVNTNVMDGTVRFLEEIFKSAELERELKSDALRRLGHLSHSWGL